MVSLCLSLSFSLSLYLSLSPRVMNLSCCVLLQPRYRSPSLLSAVPEAAPHHFTTFPPSISVVVRSLADRETHSAVSCLRGDDTHTGVCVCVCEPWPRPSRVDSRANRGEGVFAMATNYPKEQHKGGESGPSCMSSPEPDNQLHGCLSITPRA